MLTVHCYRLLLTWMHYCRLLSTAMEYYGPLSIIIVPGVTHTIGIMSGGFILVVMDVMVVWVAYCTASMIVAVVNCKLRSSLKWSMA